MIANLSIKNVALIEEAEIEFGPGLNILTGETGAGKSILIDAVKFLLGGRAGKDFIRRGDSGTDTAIDMAMVEGMILVTDPDISQVIADMGIELEEGQLLLSRTINTAGRNICRVNGRNVTVSMLKDIAGYLVDIHGQHQHQSLLNPARHIILLDRFCDLSTHKKELEALIAKYREISKELKELAGAPGQREAQIEIWQFQKNEIESAKLKPGEEEELLQKRNRLSAVDKLDKNAGEALFLLQGDDRIGRSLTLLNDLARLDESKQPLAARLNDLSISLTDIISELSDYSDSLDADPATLERVEARLDIIYRLKKKYGGTVEEILNQLVSVTNRLEKHLGSDKEIAQLKTKRREQMQAIAAKCNEMTAIRRSQAEVIKHQIVEVLRDLGMKDVQFDIAMEKQAAFTANGNDKLEFMISPNLGEPLRPLAQIASGGEMSRVMLALKTVMADVDRIGTLIFDEIDTGVSGRTAQQVAEKLVQISGGTGYLGHQLLCITHLPQIAAMATRHFLISKETEGGQTLTYVKSLDYDGSVQELARLIGGATITEATFEAAREMKDLGASPC